MSWKLHRSVTAADGTDPSGAVGDLIGNTNELDFACEIVANVDDYTAEVWLGMRDPDDLATPASILWFRFSDLTIAGTTKSEGGRVAPMGRYERFYVKVPTLNTGGSPQLDVWLLKG